MNTIFNHWKSYEANVVPPTAGPVQRLNTKLAFYAGATAFMSIMVNCADMSDAAGRAVLDGVEAEIKDFALQVSSRKA